MEIGRISDTEIVFCTPNDMSRFYELLVEQGQAIILQYSDSGHECSILIQPDFAIKVTKGIVSLKSERRLC